MKKDNKTISNISYDNKTSVLTYEANGEQIDVQGEFAIEGGVLYHTHEWTDGSEEEIALAIESAIYCEWYKSNVVVRGNIQRGTTVTREGISIGITADDFQFCDTAEEAAGVIMEQITDKFDKIDSYDIKSIKEDVIMHIDHLFE